MQLTENAAPTELLAEITRLENQISKLSLQLGADHETIELLRQTLAERESRIHELESSLVMTPKFLLQTTQSNINRIKNEIKAGLDTKLIHPVLNQIRQQLELVERLIDEAERFLAESKQIIHQNIQKVLEIADKSPAQALRYFEKTIVEPILSLVHQVLETSKQRLQATRHYIDQKWLLPSRSLYDQALDLLTALPIQSQVMFQIRILEPAHQTLNSLWVQSRQLSNDSMSALKKLLTQLMNLIDQSLTNVSDAIKNSQFWDGKHRIQAMA